MDAPCYVQTSTSEQTVGWEALPIVGAERERRALRTRVWRMIFASTAAFWAGVACMIAWIVS